MFSNPQGNEREKVKQIRQLIHKHVGGNNRNVFKCFKRNLNTIATRAKP